MIYQVQPSDTNPLLLISAKKEEIKIESLIVCNTDTSTREFYIFIDPSGSGSDIDNAIYYNSTIAASTTIDINFPLTLQRGATLHVKASVASKVTFTVSSVK